MFRPMYERRQYFMLYCHTILVVQCPAGCILRTEAQTNPLCVQQCVYVVFWQNGNKIHSRPELAKCDHVECPRIG